MKMLEKSPALREQLRNAGVKRVKDFSWVPDGAPYT